MRSVLLNDAVNCHDYITSVVVELNECRARQSDNDKRKLKY